MFGHPGTGTTLCLDYFLVRRLAQGFPTFFYDGGLWFFDTNGAMAVDPGDFQIDTYPTSEVWGLINSGTQIPPTLVESSFFLVFAGRPPNIQYNYVDAHHPGSRFHFFQPLSQTELLQANRVQIHEASDEAIIQFYREYGPSAYDCYSSLRSPYR
ncbi:hypothetical protein AB1N83_007250 [Pleurotus pulmonarius]